MTNDRLTTATARISSVLVTLSVVRNRLIAAPSANESIRLSGSLPLALCLLLARLRPRPTSM